MKELLYLISPLAENFPIDEKADYIGVDAGFEKILAAGLPCRFALGDFDSLNRLELPEGLEAIVLPVRKDETDGQSAMARAVEMGYKTIVFWGSLSGRLDHTLANLRLISCHFPQVILQDESNQARVLLKGTHKFTRNWKHISFFALENSEISLKGFEYPLENAKIDDRTVFTVSNSVKDGSAEAVVHAGRILCIQSNCR